MQFVEYFFMLVTAITCNTRTFVVQADSGPQRDHAPLPVIHLHLQCRRAVDNEPITERDKQTVACSDSIMSILDTESHRHGLKGVNIHYLGARLGKDIKDIRKELSALQIIEEVYNTVDEDHYKATSEDLLLL
ncbi:hypothetical protein PVAP13_8NG335310 [Panicum virgatum]|uniref:Uncharacterized protein n=1 Tax=Panicum virgatum TaxID=38727 RepID=A0A8T0P9F9_PANVG|nr:hypothetical protein PVAP13_8NG335310 [Panicum virgatum]